VHPEAEYIDPADFLRYREYAWSREHNRDGKRAWDALRDDVAQNGFREPAFLEYNHETGQGYLSEGNHRLGVAVELDIPLPVVVHRTRKTAPEYPMRQVTDPGQYSMSDERGFSQFREFMRPSDIGLRTVPGEREKAVGAEETVGTRRTALRTRATSREAAEVAPDHAANADRQYDERATSCDRDPGPDGMGF
jgi:hypothetical protein